MAHQMTITLTDQEYAMLVTEAAKNGKQPETFLHEIITQYLQSLSQVKHPLTGHEFMERQHRDGELLNLPTGEPLN